LPAKVLWVTVRVSATLQSAPPPSMKLSAAAVLASNWLCSMEARPLPKATAPPLVGVVLWCSQELEI
jgi:hypothetical protein